MSRNLGHFSVEQMPPFGTGTELCSTSGGGGIRRFIPIHALHKTFGDDFSSFRATLRARVWMIFAKSGINSRVAGTLADRQRVQQRTRVLRLSSLGVQLAAIPSGAVGGPNFVSTSFKVTAAGKTSDVGSAAHGCRCTSARLTPL